MPQRRATIASHQGLHARPAALFAEAAAASGTQVSIGRPDQEPVSADSMLMVMSLGLDHGEDVVLSAAGDDSAAVLAELVALLQTDLDTP